MRLLHTETFRLHGFFSRQAPHYAILSHTWGDKDVTYDEIEAATDPSAICGFSKIQGACALAKSEGFEFIWIDTCCINKSSSAELSEAINSMYLWYQRATVCYAYLADVESLPESLSSFSYRQQAISNVSSHHRFSYFRESEFSNSDWFKRGWTLQELIAPSDVIFCSKDWKFLGTKSSLKTIISIATGIEEIILKGSNLDIFSVARRMSWASGRMTTREEDMAYCLLGIFSVNMPLLYGEGEQNAFIRLQEHIITQSNDQSIFAWTIPKSGKSMKHLYGLLAPSPEAFKHTGKRVSLLSPIYRKQRTIQVVHSTIQVGVILREDGFRKPSTTRHYTDTGFKDSLLNSWRTYFEAVLDCQIGNTGDLWAGIEIKTLNPQDGKGGEGGLFCRTKPHSLKEISMKEAVMTNRAYHAMHGGPPPSQEPISLIEKYTQSWKGFWYSCDLWDLKTIEVPKNPHYPQPRGFSLQMDECQFEVSHSPSDRWYGHDKILLLSSYAQVVADLPKAQRVTPWDRINQSGLNAYDRQFSRVEGIFQIDMKPDIPGTLSLALVLGVLERYWLGGFPRREPWCHLVPLKNATDLSALDYRIDWKESPFSRIRTPKIQASVEKADRSGLFQVKLQVLE